MLPLLLFLFTSSLAVELESADKSDAVVKAIIVAATKLTGSCPPVNNLQDSNACWLRFSQMTFAGSHNSGAGKGLQMKLPFLGYSAAPACRLQNQELTIPQQLELGVRAFDLDVAYDGSSKISSSSDRVVINHCAAVCAYGEKLKIILAKIAKWLKKNDHEIVVIRIKDYKASSDTEELMLTKAILEIIQDTLGPKVLNYHTDPLMASALVLNRPVFFYLNTDLWLRIKNVKYSLRHLKKYLRPNKNLETWYGLHDEVTLQCDLKETALDYFKEDENVEIMTKNATWLPIYSDWYAANFQVGMSLCYDEMAQECRETIPDNLKIAEYLQDNYNRTVNVLMTDYTGSQTIETVAALNKLNIQHFVVKKQGDLDLGIAHSHHMSKYPFVPRSRRKRATEEVDRDEDK